MKLNVVKTYNTTFYHAYLITDVGINVAARLGLMSSAPVTIEFESLEQMAEEKGAADSGTMYAMLKAAGATTVAMLKAAGATTVAKLSTTNGTPLRIIRGGEGKMRSEVYDSPMYVIMNDGKDIVHGEDWMPEAIGARLCKGDTMEKAEKDTSDIIKDSLERLRTAVEADKAHGIDSRLVNEADSLKMMGEALLGLAKVETVVLDGDNARYISTEVTDFSNAGIVTNGQLLESPKLRVAHVDPPQWHAATGAAKDAGFVGYWAFKGAATVKSEDSDDKVIIGFTGYESLRVLVRSAESINPAGRVAIPVEVYEAITHAKVDPAQTMDVKEGSAYTRDHVATGTCVDQVRQLGFHGETGKWRTPSARRG